MGPEDDISEGQDFIVRTIGRVYGRRRGGGGEPKQFAEEEDEDADDPEDEDEEDVTGVPNSEEAYSEVADLLNRVSFQSCGAITTPARFLPREEVVRYKESERSTAVPYRKGQLDPSVYHQALGKVLQMSTAPLGTSDALVVLTGGTPEALVAGISVGFKTIFVVADTAEAELLQLPTPTEQHAMDVDYSKCPPWPAELPDLRGSGADSLRCLFSISGPGSGTTSLLTLTGRRGACWPPLPSACWRNTSRTTRPRPTASRCLPPR
jgi:hypothetical protein